MTPEWLYKHSTITKPLIVHSKYLEISAGIFLSANLQIRMEHIVKKFI